MAPASRCDRSSAGPATLRPCRTSSCATPSTLSAPARAGWEWAAPSSRVADDGTASSFNPAGLAQLRRTELAAVGFADRSARRWSAAARCRRSGHQARGPDFFGPGRAVRRGRPEPHRAARLPARGGPLRPGRRRRQKRAVTDLQRRPGLREPPLVLPPPFVGGGRGRRHPVPRRSGRSTPPPCRLATADLAAGAGARSTTGWRSGSATGISQLQLALGAAAPGPGRWSSPTPMTTPVHAGPEPARASTSTRLPAQVRPGERGRGGAPAVRRRLPLDRAHHHPAPSELGFGRGLSPDHRSLRQQPAALAAQRGGRHRPAAVPGPDPGRRLHAVAVVAHVHRRRPRRRAAHERQLDRRTAKPRTPSPTATSSTCCPPPRAPPRTPASGAPGGVPARRCRRWWCPCAAGSSAIARRCASWGPTKAAASGAVTVGTGANFNRLASTSPSSGARARALVGLAFPPGRAAGRRQPHRDRAGGPGGGLAHLSFRRRRSDQAGAALPLRGARRTRRTEVDPDRGGGSSSSACRCRRPPPPRSGSTPMPVAWRRCRQRQGAGAAELFERAIRLRAEPGNNLITYGTNRLDRYHPYLRLAEAHLLAGEPEKAKEALARSAARREGARRRRSACGGWPRRRQKKRAAEATPLRAPAHAAAHHGRRGAPHPPARRSPLRSVAQPARRGHAPADRAKAGADRGQTRWSSRAAAARSPTSPSASQRTEDRQAPRLRRDRAEGRRPTTPRGLRGPASRGAIGRSRRRCGPVPAALPRRLLAGWSPR